MRILQEEEEKKKNKKKSLLPSSSALTEVEVFPEMLLPFYQTACSHIPADSDHHENVRC
jgi:hypothetical protein